MSRATSLDNYRNTPEAEAMIKKLGVARVETTLEEADVVNTVSNKLASLHDGEIGIILRLSDSPVIERVYKGECPKLGSVEHTAHSYQRASERGFYNDEVIELAETGILACQDRDVVAFNLLKGNTIVIPVTSDGLIKTVFSRQGKCGKLRLGDTDVDRLTRTYLSRGNR